MWFCLIIKEIWGRQFRSLLTTRHKTISDSVPWKIISEQLSRSYFSKGTQLALWVLEVGVSFPWDTVGKTGSVKWRCCSFSAAVFPLTLVADGWQPGAAAVQREM